MLLKYEMDREMRLRMEEQRKADRLKQEQEEMRKLLARQVEEKRRREEAFKANTDEQATIWARDKQIYEAEEERLHKKIKQINSENAAFLQRQVQEKESKLNQKKMNRQEFALNKPLLREIQMKRKGASEFCFSILD